MTDGNHKLYVWIFAMVVGLIVAWLCKGCTNLDPVNPSPPLPETSCEAAEMQLDALGCDDLMVVPGPDEVIDTEDDMLWVEYCEIIQESGIIVLNTDCVVESADCKEAEQCLN